MKTYCRNCKATIIEQDGKWVHAVTGGESCLFVAAPLASRPVQ